MSTSYEVDVRHIVALSPVVREYVEECRHAGGFGRALGRDDLIRDIGYYAMESLPPLKEAMFGPNGVRVTDEAVSAVTVLVDHLN